MPDHVCRKEEVIDLVLQKVTVMEADVKKLLVASAVNKTIIDIKSGVWGIFGGALVIGIWYIQKGL